MTGIVVDLGETYYSENFEVRDTTGALANAGTVTATVTLPDDTTNNPTVANPSVGVYNFKYLTTALGAHSLLVSATGGTLGTDVLRWTDAFTVRPLTGAIISLAQAKKHLNIPVATDTDREELRRKISSATWVVEFFCGPVVRRTYTDEVVGGGCQLVLHRDQIVSLTSVTPILTSAPTVDVADLDVSSSGIVRHKSGLPISWGTLRVVYVAGRTDIPDNLIEAALIIVAHLWDTQRGPNTRTFLGQEDRETTYVPQIGFAIPNRAIDLMKMHPAPAGVA